VRGTDDSQLWGESDVPLADIFDIPDRDVRKPASRSRPPATAKGPVGPFASPGAQDRLQRHALALSVGSLLN
jgi:hypothetical protein